MAQFPDDPFEHSRRAVNDAARHARRVRFSHRHEAPWVFGVFLVSLGVAFLLDNLNIIEARDVFRSLWPVLLMAWGLSKVLFGRGGEKVFGAVATVLGGLWLGDRFFDWDINVMGVFWPLILIGLGLSMLFRSPRRRSSSSFGPFAPPVPGAPIDDAAAPPGEGPDDVDQAASIREVAVMAGVERRNVSQAFRGGSITAVMGSVELDLRDCRVADQSAHISVQVVLGEVVLRVPRDWTIDSRLGAVLGSLEDRSDPPISGTPKRLILDGSLFLGQVAIRN